jgi:T5SS/PEP-CTERM-associated repeat protein
LLLTNTQVSAIGVNGYGQLIVSSGSFATPSSFLMVGSGAGSQGALTVEGGICGSSPFGGMVVGMETDSTGVVTINGGTLFMTNASLTLVGCDGTGQLSVLNGANTFGAVEVGGDPGSQGTFTVAGGVSTVQDGFFVGAGAAATGTVWLTGGTIIATNLPATIGSWGSGVMTVSNGTWAGCSMALGVHAIMTTSAPITISQGTLNVNGGTVTLSSKLIIGNCVTGGVGTVNITGGSLFVTNAAHNAYIDVRNGQLNLNGGLLNVDILFTTNTCGHVATNGGTLVVNNIIISPDLDTDGDGMNNLQEYLAGTDPKDSTSYLHITSIVSQLGGIFLKWSVVPGKTYAVQVTTNTGGYAGGYSTLATVAVPQSVSITETNYLDFYGASGTAPRFYRVGLVQN